MSRHDTGTGRDTLFYFFKDFCLPSLLIWTVPLWGTRIIRLSCGTYGTTSPGMVFSITTGLFCLLVVALSLLASRSSRTAKNPDPAEPLPTPSLRALTVFDALALAAMYVGAALIVIPLGLPPTVSASVGVALGTVGYVWSMMRWMQFLCRLNIRTAMGYMFISYGIFFIIYLLIRDFSPIMDGIIAFGLPILSVLGYRLAFRSSNGLVTKDTLFYTGENLGDFLPAVMGIAALSFIAQLKNGLPIFENNALSHTVCGILGLAIVFGLLWWVVARRSSLSFARTFQILLLLLATAIVVPVLFPAEVTDALFAGIALACTYLISMFIRLVIVDVSHFGIFGPFVTTGVVWAAYELPRPIASWCRSAYIDLSPAAQDSSAMLAVAILYVAILCTAFLFAKDLSGTRPIFGDYADAVGSDGYAFLDNRCQALGIQYGLTARELDIMRHLCRGRSKAYIAETLMVSENTVRTHSRSLYAKLGVHSKQELLDLVQESSER